MIAEVARRHDPKRADGRERAAFGSAESVRAISIVHNVSVVTAGQVEIAREHIARSQLTWFVISVWPARVIAVAQTVGCIVVSVVRTGPATELASLIIPIT